MIEVGAAVGPPWHTQEGPHAELGAEEGAGSEGREGGRAGMLATSGFGSRKLAMTSVRRLAAMPLARARDWRRRDGLLALPFEPPFEVSFDREQLNKKFIKIIKGLKIYLKFQHPTFQKFRHLVKPLLFRHL